MNPITTPTWILHRFISILTYNLRDMINPITTPASEFDGCNSDSVLFFDSFIFSWIMCWSYKKITLTFQFIFSFDSFSFYL